MGSFKGSPSALGASATVTNITVDGDLTLDDGGSIKEAGGVAAITVDGSGDISKIGQTTHTDGYFLKWNNGASKAEWASVSSGGGADVGVANTFTEGQVISKDTDGELVALKLKNESDANNTTGIVSLQFDLEDTGGTAVDSGKIAVKKEVAFTGTAATQDSNMVFSTSLNGTLTEQMTLDSDGILTCDAGVTVGSTVITDDSIVMTPSSGDTATIAAGANGTLTITTVDTAAAAANVGFVVDGAFDIDAAGAVTIDGSAITIGGDSDVAIDIDASTLDIDASGAVTIDGAGVAIAAGSNEVDITTTGAVDVNSGAFTLDASTVSIDSTDNINITAAGSGKTLDIDASGALTIDSATSIAIGANADKPIDIDASTLDIDASGAVTLDGDSVTITSDTVTITSATSQKPTLELKNTTASDSNDGAIMSFTKAPSNDAGEADDNVLGGIKFNGIDSGNSATTYGQFTVHSSDKSGGDEAGEFRFKVMAGGTAGAAGLVELLTIGGEDTNASTPCEVIVNEAAIDCDFRVESADETHMLFVDAANSRVSIGDSADAPAATLEITNHASAGATGVPLLQLNSNDVDKIAIDINAANTTANVIDIVADDCLTSGKVLHIDVNDASTSAITPEYIHFDFDKDGVVGDGVTSTFTGLDLDMNDGATNHANATVTMTGIDIDMVSANAQGTITNTGISLNVAGADTNLALDVLAGAVRVADDTAIFFGDGFETAIKYDEAGDDQLMIEVGDAGLAVKGTTTGSDAPTLLSLLNNEAAVSADDVLGKLQWRAANETGTDAIVVAAAIQATAEADFDADQNETKMEFMLGRSEAATTKATLDSNGLFTANGGLKSGTAAGSGADVIFYTAGTAAHVGLTWDADLNTEGTLVGGADDHGVDFKFFGETAGKFVQWDQSADALIVTGLANVDGELDLDSGATTGNAAAITANSLTTGGGLVVETSATNDNAGSLVKIAQAGSRAGSAASIGLEIDFNTVANANARAFKIDSEQTTGVVAEIDATAITTGTGMTIAADGLTTGAALSVTSNASSAGDNRSIVKITNDHADAALAIPLDIKNDAETTDAAGVVMLKMTAGTGGDVLALKAKTATIATPSGAVTKTTSNFFPAGCIPVGFAIKVTTVIPGSKFITKIGVGGSLDYAFGHLTNAGSGGGGLGTTDDLQAGDDFKLSAPKNDGERFFEAATDLTVTFDGDPGATSGVIRFTMYYYQMDAG